MKHFFCGSGPLRCMAVTSLNLLPTFLSVYNFYISNIPTLLTPLIFKYKNKNVINIFFKKKYKTLYSLKWIKHICYLRPKDYQNSHEYFHKFINLTILHQILNFKWTINCFTYLDTIYPTYFVLNINLKLQKNINQSKFWFQLYMYTIFC